MIEFNSHFDKVVCVNLVNRPDKKEQMIKRFKQYGINVEWFNAVEYGFAREIVTSLNPNFSGFPRFNTKHPNEFGAAMSHYTVIKTALEQGVKKLFVFEDDAMFRKGFLLEFDKAMKTIPEDWDMFNLYSFMYKILPENIRISRRWIKSFNSWSLMSYAINEKAMKMYISEMDKHFRIADLTSFEMQNTELNIYSVVPTLCIPNIKIGSNIRGDNMNYSDTNTIINLGFGNENYE